MPQPTHPVELTADEIAVTLAGLEVVDPDSVAGCHARAGALQKLQEMANRLLIGPGFLGTPYILRP